MYKYIPVNYDESLVSLACSVLKHFGAPYTHCTLEEFDKLLAKGYKNVVVMLFDGMGTAILEKHKRVAPFLIEHNIRRISSVFPPTTTAATTSIETGLTPCEHGWLGWALYFKEVDKNVCLFTNTEFGKDEIAADYPVAKTAIPFDNLETKIRKTGKQAYFVSKYADIKTDSVQTTCNIVRELCEKEGEKYIYCYWNQPDHDMHDFGTTHANVTEQIRLINDEVETLCKDLKDTLVIVTADHGLIDAEWKSLCDYPEIADCLERVPSIESRAMSVFVKKGRGKEFEKAFNAAFGKDYILLSHDEVLNSNLFGAGKPNSRFEDFVGDYVAIATGKTCINPFAPDDEPFIGMHAGLSKDETFVPFIAIET